MTEMRGTFLSRRKRKKKGKNTMHRPDCCQALQGGGCQGFSWHPSRPIACLLGRQRLLYDQSRRPPAAQDETPAHLQSALAGPNLVFCPRRTLAATVETGRGLSATSSGDDACILLVPLASLPLSLFGVAHITGEGRGPSAAWPAAWPAWDGGSCSHLDGWTDSLRCARRCPLCCIRLVLGIGWLVLSGWLLRVLYRRSSSLLPRGLPPFPLLFPSLVTRYV